MDPLPTPVRDCLARFAAERGRLAWIEVDARGVVLARGGDLERHGLARLAPGDELAEALPALGALEEHELPRLELGAGHLADLVLRRAGERWLVLVLDSTGRMSRERAAVQKANELELLREALEARVGGASPPQRDGASEGWSEPLSTMGIALLERLPGGELRPAGTTPAWLSSVWGLVREAERAPSGDPDDTTFLGNFLVDARRFWSGARPGLLRSGPWSEAGVAEGAVLEACAILTDAGRAWLAIEALGPEDDPQRPLLQRARETRLDYDELRAEVEKKEILLHCIVHDLKGPLASIVGVLSMLLGRTPPAERTRELLELALRQARRQDDHIRAVLEVFAAEVEAFGSFARDLSRAPEPAALAALAVARWLPAFEARGRFLELDERAGPGLPVAADAGYLERVLDNLLENALRHAPPGGTVVLRVERSEDGARLSVIDHGEGVDASQARDLFRRGARGRGGGSAGLGLYFCRRTVERWGGRAFHEPTPGGGATFGVELRALRTSSPP